MSSSSVGFLPNELLDPEAKIPAAPPGFAAPVVVGFFCFVEVKAGVEVGVGEVFVG